MSTQIIPAPVPPALEPALRSWEIGDLHTALTILEDAICQRNAVGETDRIHALYLRAAIIKQCDEPEAAIYAFDEVLNQSMAKPVSQWMLLSAYEKGCLQFNLKHYDGAVETLDLFVKLSSTFTENGRVAAMRWLAFGLKLESLHALSLTSKLRIVCQRIVEGYANSEIPQFRGLVSRAIDVCPEIILQIPPAAHSLHSKYEQDVEAEIREKTLDYPELQTKFLAAHRDLVEKDSVNDANLHQSAIERLNGVWSEKRPFALMLRSFGLEAHHKVLGAGAGVNAHFSSGSYGEIESQIVESLPDWLPAIGISNPQSKDVTHQITKLEVHNEYWVAVVRALVGRANLIVMLLESESPGVQIELEIIRDQGKEARTLMVFTPKDVTPPLVSGFMVPVALDQIKHHVGQFLELVVSD